VYSQRKWTVQGGDFTDDPLPTYDWLEQEQETETESVTADGETAAPTEPADTPTESTSAVTDGETSASDKKGCRSTVSVVIPMIATGLALTLSKKGERKVSKDLPKNGKKH
jgi:hypothetical protein